MIESEVFVAEENGRIYVFDNLSDTSATFTWSYQFNANGGHDLLQEALDELGGLTFTQVAMHPGPVHAFGKLGPDAVPVIWCCVGFVENPA